MSLLSPKTALDPADAEHGDMEKTDGYSTYAPKFPCPCVCKLPQKSRKSRRVCAHGLLIALNQKQTISWAMLLKKNPTWSAPNPPATTIFGWFPTLKIAVTNV